MVLLQVPTGWAVSYRRLPGSTSPRSGVYVGVRLIDFVYHSTLGLRVIKKKKVRVQGRACDTKRNTPAGVPRSYGAAHAPQEEHHRDR